MGIIAAFITFLFFKNKQENRAIDRRNRIAEKQEELVEQLRKNNSQQENITDDEN
ncbi:hypothetical protein [Ferruginibacter profundus]